MILLVSLALARPTSGGGYAFDDTDTVTWVDGPTGAARVWYSTEGNNVVQAGDADGDGVPDFAALVAATTEEVLLFYQDQGFRPIPDDGDAGGSAAMDVYLVDFHGDADGHYSTESCDRDDVCSGYFVMENDFAGYGYSNDAEAVRVLTSHELFHGVQGAYDYDEEGWYQEGTAVWAERLYDPESDDFLWFCQAYLADAGRSLSRPPAGPIPTFSYSTALWWWFATERYGTGWMVDFLEATTSSDDLLAMLDERVDLATDWVDFASWNLATGRLAGVEESYTFAAELRGLVLEDTGASLDDDQRFYPLATTYYKLEHGGGPLQFGLEADAPDLVFRLYATNAAGQLDGLVAEPAPTVGLQELGDFDAGDYYLLGTNPTLAEDSTKVRFCLGPDASDCVPAGEDTAPPDDEEVPEECGCASAGVPGGWLALAGALLVGRRRGARGAAGRVEPIGR